MQRTCGPWRDLLARYGTVSTVSRPFFGWRAAGLRDRVLAALRAEADRDLRLINAAVVCAIQASRLSRAPKVNIAVGLSSLL